jgi:hypothetical protein
MPAKAPEAIMVGANREPSSFVQLMSSSGDSVVTLLSSSVRSTSRPTSTPATPSNFPPEGCVSRWLPKAMGSLALSRPGLRAKMLPTSSTVTVQPRALHCATNQSRTCLSSSLSVRRVIPPPGVPPNFALSTMVPQSRSPFTRRDSTDTSLIPSDAALYAQGRAAAIVSP